MSDKETAQMKTVSADDLRQVETEIFEKQGLAKIPMNMPLLWQTAFLKLICAA